jgi:hypothetical protein
MTLTDSQAITVMRQSSPGASELPIYVHNGFDPGRFDDFVASRQDFVVQDHHSYFVFTPSDDSESASRHTNDIHGYISANMDRASKKQHGNLVIDEWSCALTPNSIANESNPIQARKDFCTGQMDVYSNTTAGWSFWCKWCMILMFVLRYLNTSLQLMSRNNVTAMLIGVLKLRLVPVFPGHSSRTEIDQRTNRNYSMFVTPLKVRLPRLSRTFWPSFRKPRQPVLYFLVGSALHLRTPCYEGMIYVIVLKLFVSGGEDKTVSSNGTGRPNSQF